MLSVIIGLLAFQSIAARSNLALFRPVVSSSVGEDNPPLKAINGIMNDRWESNTNDSEWIRVDLGVRYAVDSVFVSWETAAGLDYAIQLADAPLTGDSGWTTVARVTNGAQGEKRSITFTPATGRYVRLRGYKRASIFGYSIWEFEIYGNAAACVPPTVQYQPDDRTFTAGLPTYFMAYAVGTALSYQWQKQILGGAVWTPVAGATNAYYAFKPTAADSGSVYRCVISNSCGADTTSGASLSFSKKGRVNLACKKYARCTSAEGGNLVAANVVDDDSSTRWGTDYKTDPKRDSAWVYVDLGATIAIDSVYLDWEHSGSKEYLVQVAPQASLNDQGWTTVSHITDGNAWEKRGIKFASVQTRFVRVRCLKLIADFGYSMFEFEVYGPNSSPVVVSDVKQSVRDLFTVKPAGIVIRLVPNGNRALSADILDTKGRLVRRLTGDRTDALIWNYRDGAGRRVPAGVYLIRVVSGMLTVEKMVAVYR
jgi:hypothetical protein